MSNSILTLTTAFSVHVHAHFTVNGMYHKIVMLAFIVLSSMVFKVSGSQGVSPQKLYRFDTKPIRGEGEKDSFEEV